MIWFNLIGTFNMICLASAQMSALDALEDEEPGVIVSMASIAAFDGQVRQAASARRDKSRTADQPEERSDPRYLCTSQIESLRARTSVGRRL